jgi:hypothetical protein
LAGAGEVRSTLFGDEGTGLAAWLSVAVALDDELALGALISLGSDEQAANIPAKLTAAAMAA